MRWLIGLALLAAALWLLGQVRLGGGGEYRAEGLFLWLRVGPWRITVFPLGKKRPKKRKKERRAAAKPGQAPPPPAPPAPLRERIGGAVEYARALLPIALEAAGRVKGKLRVDRLSLEVTVGAANPADAAMGYGRASAALGAAWGALNEAFLLRDARACVKVDYNAPKTTVYALADLSLKVGQAVWLGLYFGIKGMRAFLRVRGRKKQEQQQRKAA